LYNVFLIKNLRSIFGPPCPQIVCFPVSFFSLIVCYECITYNLWNRYETRSRADVGQPEKARSFGHLATVNTSRICFSMSVKTRLRLFLIRRDWIRLFPRCTMILLPIHDVYASHRTQHSSGGAVSVVFNRRVAPS